VIDLPGRLFPRISNPFNRGERFTRPQFAGARQPQDIAGHDTRLARLESFRPITPSRLACFPPPAIPLRRRLGRMVNPTAPSLTSQAPRFEPTNNPPQRNFSSIRNPRAPLRCLGHLASLSIQHDFSKMLPCLQLAQRIDRFTPRKDRVDHGMQFIRNQKLIHFFK
jgi:hypothetical protein